MRPQAWTCAPGMAGPPLSVTRPRSTAIGSARGFSLAPGARVRLALVVNVRDATGDVYVTDTTCAPASRPAKA